MINRIILVLAVTVCCGLTVTFGQKTGSGKETAPASLATKPAAGKSAVSELPPVGYDPTRDATADIKKAAMEAERTGKRVFVEVGGEWCIWCHRMEDFINTHPDLLKLRDDNFVTVRVNYSDDNKNEAVLSGYPPVAGYPHIFILNADGSVLHSQDTGDLEDGKKSYDLDKYRAFLTQWAPSTK